MYDTWGKTLFAMRTEKGTFVTKELSAPE